MDDRNPCLTAADKTLMITTPMRLALALCLAAPCVGCGTEPVDVGTGETHQLSIRFDYRFDDAGFFDNLLRRRALEAAAEMWSSRLADDFAEVPAGTRLRLRDPEERENYVWVDLDESIDDILIFVGTTEDMPGVGRAGPSGFAESDDPRVTSALADRARGGDFEPWAGSLSIKGSTTWFFDATPDTDHDLPAEANDFVLYAAHEIGHVLGFSTCDAFNGLVDGTSYVGEEATALFGGEVPLAADGGHFATSTALRGEETLMDPGGESGRRKRPTPLDLAVLKDLGYELID